MRITPPRFNRRGVFNRTETEEFYRERLAASEHQAAIATLAAVRIGHVVAANQWRKLLDELLSRKAEDGKDISPLGGKNLEASMESDEPENVQKR